MILQDEKGILYNHIIERNLEKLFQSGIDLKPYFNCNMPFVKIEGTNTFKEYDEDSTEIVVPANVDNIQEILMNYDKIIGCNLNQ